MSLGRLVPWASWNEWRQVGQWLFSPTPEDVLNGLDRVAAWRVRGRLPLGVDITACLLETRARDPLPLRAALGPQALYGPAAALPDSQLRLQYAMALVRMVNGIADSSQKGRVAASVASLAAAAGLPRILVDLRHESTHNELPSAASLRLAADQALAWLQLNYWQRQAEHLEGCRDKMGELVQEFVSLHAAAAAKVASSQAANEGTGEDGTPAGATTAAAAAAAAAVVAKGKKASGGNWAAAPAASPAKGAAAAGAAGPTPAAPSAAGEAEGYTAAEGQRRRKALLAELKMGVPRPAASLLVEPLLAAGASDATLSAAGGDPAALERALATAMPHFAKEWPQLPGMLLRAAVEHLAACAAGTAGKAAAAGEDGPFADGGVEPQQQISAAAWVAWVGRLAPRPQAPASSSGAQQSKQQQQQQQQQAAKGVVPGWAPSPALLRELVASCLPALMSCTHRACMTWVATGGGSSSGTSEQGRGAGAATGGEAAPAGAAELAGALQATLRLLVESWRAAGASSAALARCAALLASSRLPGQQSHQRQQQEQQPPADARRGAAVRQQQATAADEGSDPDSSREPEGVPAMEQQLAEAEQRVQALRQKRAAARPEASASSAKRWRRAASWAPCALGNLPSPSDPNGRPAPRELAAPASQATEVEGSMQGVPGETVRQGRPDETSDHAAAAAAAAQLAPPQRQGQMEPSHGPAEALAIDAAALGLGISFDWEWPLADMRFTGAGGYYPDAELSGTAAASHALPRQVVVPPLELLL